MSLLTMTQGVALKVLKTLPSAIPTAAGSNDPNILDIVGFLNEDGQELAERATWQQLKQESSFSTVGASGGILKLSTLVGGAGYADGFTNTYNLVNLTGGHGTGAQATIQITNGVVASVSINLNSQGSGYQVGDVLSASNTQLGGTGAGFTITVATVGIVGAQAQGAIATLAGPGFKFIINETFWDRTTRRPVFGPKTSAEWQQLEAQLMQGPWYQYTVRGGQLLMLPAPAPGDLCFFEWQSGLWCTNSGGTQAQSSLLADSDVSLIDENLLVLGGIWRFREANGLHYLKAQDKYERKFADLTSRNVVKPKLNLAGNVSDIYPGIIVPAGNWPVSGEPTG